jgi:muramoyltetrapeptide carboxypeptidase
MPLVPLKSVSPLSAGARVALVAPAGGLRGEPDVERAIANVRTMGWEPVLGAHLLAHVGYFAGTDAQRLDDLNAAIRNPAVDGIWCIRGGYGTARLLPGVDFEAVVRRPRAIIGFSDVTALHCAIQRECGVISYHGPVARAALTDFARASLETAVIGVGDPCGAAPSARVLRGGAAEGVLVGGNLAVLTSLVGTRYAPDLNGSILVLEDIDERTYRIDRMLRQLQLAGLLANCRAIVFGECTDCAEGTQSGSRSLDEVLLEMAELIGIPCVAGAPIGHIDDQWTVPLGAYAHLDADALTLTVTR